MIFTRQLSDVSVQTFGNAAGAPGDNLWKDLLRCWKPYGDDGLRLAIRNDYLNFYALGQSVANISASRGRIQTLVHSKYLGRLAGKYVAWGETDYRDPAMLQEWIARAKGFAGKEKPEIDLTVAANPEIIDLEMAFSTELGADEPPSKRLTKARRIDFVALERAGAAIQLVFWEAKRITSGDLKSRSDRPKILTQMGRYEKYLTANQEPIRTGYSRVCALLVKFGEMARSLGNNVRLDALIHEVAASPSSLSVDKKPRLVIFETKDDFRDGAWDGHEGKLRRNGIELKILRNGQYRLREDPA